VNPPSEGDDSAGVESSENPEADTVSRQRVVRGGTFAALGSFSSQAIALVGFIRRIQIEHRSHDKNQVSSHSAIVAAAIRRDVEGGVELLRQHIEMTVSATQQALKDALLKVFSPGEPTARKHRGRARSA